MRTIISSGECHADIARRRVLEDAVDRKIPGEFEYEGADSGVDCWANADGSLRMSLCVEEYAPEDYTEAGEPSLELFAKGYMASTVSAATFPAIQGDVQEVEPELVAMEGEVPVLVGSVTGGGLMSPKATYVFAQTPENLPLVMRLAASRGSLSASQDIDALVDAIVSSMHLIPVEEEPEPTVDAQETAGTEADGEYQQYDYEEYARYPEAHFFDSVVLSGAVAQVVGSRGDDDYAVRLATRGGSSDVVYVYIVFDPGYNILEDDRLTVYGYALGTVTYQAVLGNSITIPAVTATSVVLG